MYRFGNRSGERQARAEQRDVVRGGSNEGAGIAVGMVSLSDDGNYVPGGKGAALLLVTW